MVSAEENDLLLERQLCFGLSVASRTVIAAYKPVLAELQLTHPQYLVMLALWEQAPRRVKDIGGALRLESATLSPLLRRLEDLGFLTRTRDAADERALCVDLTAAGAGLREKALSVPGTMMARLGLDRRSAMELHRAMMALIESATHADDAASPPSAVPPAAAGVSDMAPPHPGP